MRYTPSHKPLHDDLIDSLAFHVKLISKGYRKVENTIPENSVAEIIEADRKEHNRLQRLLPRRYREFYPPLFLKEKE